MGILNIFILSNSRPGDSVGGHENQSVENESGRIRITPPAHLFKTLLIKTKIRKIDNFPEVVTTLSRDANVRCLDCGWKYNFQSSTQCPICNSERTYLLSKGTFFAGALTIALIVITFCGILILAYRSITT
jgi:hypothetical protein